VWGYQWCARVIFGESESSKIFLSLVMTWSSRVTSSHWFASSSQMKFHIFLWLFMPWNGAQHAIKWCYPIPSFVNSSWPKPQTTYEKILIVWMMFDNKLLSSFLMSAIYSFLKYVRYRCRQAMVTRGWAGSGLPDSTPAGFYVILSHPDPNPESKISVKPDLVSS